MYTKTNDQVLFLNHLEMYSTTILWEKMDNKHVFKIII